MRDLVGRQFRPEDLIQIIGGDDWVRRGAEARAKGPAYTLYCAHGEVAACAGVTIYWEGMGEVWLELTEHARANHRVDLVVWTRRLLDLFAKEHKLRRMQCDVLASSQERLHFVQHFGFKIEGLMRKYDVLGRDYYRLARIEEV